MKATFLQAGEKKMLLKLVKNPLYGLNMRLSKVFSTDQDII